MKKQNKTDNDKRFGELIWMFAFVILLIVHLINPITGDKNTDSIISILLLLGLMINDRL